ncbi:myosin-binding protein H-like isoform X2 [Stegostoma tigrinum]|uniref:myosin-binding protein H-like isoform X2 n=1 Tax=Stegostoma tigrinum TaxID=3053191 RepID=UPI0028708327|nr:myosin-binding protein H-like isoform X2 [Stegostoma tigrinum]
MSPSPPAASEIPLEVPEGQPLDLAVDDVTGTSLTLNWNPPMYIGPAGLAGYLVEYRKESNETWVAVNKEVTTKTVLVIKNLTEGDKVQPRVKAVHGDGGIGTAVFPDSVLIRQSIDPPKIRLPRNLRETFVREAGQPLNLSIPIQGNPQPSITWTKDEQPVDQARVNIRNSPRDTILFIRKLERKDSGKYKLTAQTDSLVDEVAIDIQVVEKPGPPQNLKMLDVWGFNVALEWQPPADNGNAEVNGYTIQKADKKTGEWFTVIEKCHPCSYTVSNLVMGNRYNFRVFSENLCGLSETAAQCKDTANIPKISSPYNAPVYQEKDFNEAPKFTQPPVDKTATEGFTTKLFCSVRGNPKPRISWLKNQMLIDQNPKFRILTNEGICTLEIRKPSTFDGGVYTCRAVNALGEAVADCRLNVKTVTVSQ